MKAVYKEALELHEENKGKIAVSLKIECNNAKDLSLAYSPGVAQPCLEIEKDKSLSYTYTNRANTIAVISDGTAVLGLGDIGPEAAMPVMEGKALLFKRFGEVDAFPLVVDTKDPEEIIKFCKQIAPSLGGINLEDISAPRCVEIERRLIEELNIPVFHDDQHGTAIVVLAGLINSMKLTGKKPEECKVVVNGTGSAGSSIMKMLYNYGFTNIIAFDSKGCLHPKNEARYDFLKKELLTIVNKEKKDYVSLAEALIGADVFLGISVANVVTKNMVKTMAEKPVIMAMANPNPEITYEDAKEAGAYIVGTGRSDYPNQINNLLAFPYIFRGVLDAKGTKITDDIKIATSVAIASLVSDDELSSDCIIPSPFDERLLDVVSSAVKEACIKSGFVRA